MKYLSNQNLLQFKTALHLLHKASELFQIWGDVCVWKVFV